MAQIETVLLDLVSEVRQGRRQPFIASLHETNNDSVWKELESELAAEGISSTDIGQHKLAIKVLVQGLLGDSSADTASLLEVVRFVESGNCDTDSGSLSNGLSALDLLLGGPAESLTRNNTETDSFTSIDSGDYESAEEELPTNDVGASDPSTQPSFDDALGYVVQVQFSLLRQPDTYSRFLEILQSYNSGCLSLEDVINWVSAILVCHPDLVQEFNTFVPDGYRIECGMVDSHYAFRVVMPFAAYVRVPDLQAMQSLDLREPSSLHIGLLKWIDPASLNLLRPCSPISAPMDWTEQLASSASDSVESRIRSSGRLKTFLARLKAAKEAAIETGRHQERSSSPHISDRPRLTMSIRRALQR